jgi:ribosomal protein S27AE
MKGEPFIMIIKCPNCQNNFLSPDDLHEGQKLKCGRCGYTWDFTSKTNKIPEAIKPDSDIENLEIPKEEALNFENKKSINFIKMILLFLCILGILTYGFSKIYSDIKIKPFVNTHIIEKITKSNNDINKALVVEDLTFKNIVAEEENGSIYVLGEIKNNKNDYIEVPNILINNKFLVEPDKETACPFCIVYFRTTLPTDVETPIKVMFK